ncbi:hypothetical protein B484DRAFT_414234 [Ochromonadaceae sp. CCMP2298]|nr:hypothetical protein B484DRAFT_414234 [Ochromonadaceae sp. CCMP2298]
MGRVRRYKKYNKSDDPLAAARKGDAHHDEPPNLFQERTKKTNRAREDKWDDEEGRERLMQREAMRDLRLESAKKLRKERTIEGQREGESAKAFKERVREETRKTLAEQVGKMSSTAKKRKERLKERSKKRKEKKGPVDEQQRY